ncbi:hypothetical protein [Caballeronia temeraria]|uniref:hypothetical protein n=1 Tax=Caballeronia temeraria TaxID=1777137 RepID=UPI000A895717|nr:hypothetical protein [Caballeronia temeraria]
MTIPDLSNGCFSTARIASGMPPAHYGKPNINGVWDKVKSGGKLRLPGTALANAFHDTHCEKLDV